MNRVSVHPRRRYRFRLADVMCPSRQQVRQQTTTDLEVVGKVVFLSDRGQEPDRFAIIEVEGIYSPLVVPVERLQPLLDTHLERTGEEVPVHQEPGLGRAD